MAIGHTATPTGKPFTLDAGTFARYRVIGTDHKRVIRDAKLAAKVCGLVVRDVVAAVLQDVDADEWIVELRVATR